MISTKILFKISIIYILPILLGLTACKTYKPSATEGTASYDRHNFWQGRKPTWQEEFSQSTHFDTTKWSKIPRGSSDWDNVMSDYDSLFAMRDGKLILRGIKNDRIDSRDSSPYITGGIWTKGKVNFGMGRIDIRAKLNGITGSWPAFWMLGQNKQWPSGGEIDIIERLSREDTVYQTVHTSYTLHQKGAGLPHGGKASFNPEIFNIFSVAKFKDSIVFYVNGKRTFMYPKVSELVHEDQFPFADQNHYLLLDMQLGGSWVGDVNINELPVEMEIDWVRYYKFR